MILITLLLSGITLTHAAGRVGQRRNIPGAEGTQDLAGLQPGICLARLVHPSGTLFRSDSNLLTC